MMPALPVFATLKEAFSLLHANRTSLARWAVVPVLLAVAFAAIAYGWSATTPPLLPGFFWWFGMALLAVGQSMSLGRTVLIMAALWVSFAVYLIVCLAVWAPFSIRIFQLAAAGEAAATGHRRTLASPIGIRFAAHVFLLMYVLLAGLQLAALPSSLWAELGRHEHFWRILDVGMLCLPVVLLWFFCAGMSFFWLRLAPIALGRQETFSRLWAASAGSRHRLGGLTLLFTVPCMAMPVLGGPALSSGPPAAHWYYPASFFVFIVFLGIVSALASAVFGLAYRRLRL